jgi:hypothetical protein
MRRALVPAGALPVSLARCCVLAGIYLALAAGAQARTITWSEYTWDVRSQGLSAPGPNVWSDAPANVRVEGSELVLAIAQDADGRWAAAEVDNQLHLGYGTYTWVVNSDLGRLDADDVLGMFTYGGASPSNNEIDIEAARWGNPAWPSGSATVWQDVAADRSQSQPFSYSGRPPYVNRFTWEPGRVDHLVQDATGAVLLDSVVTSGVPTPSVEVPVINYWRFEGRAPAGVRSLRLASFTWTPPGDPAPLPAPAPAPALAPATAAPDNEAPRVVVGQPSRRTYRAGRALAVTFSCTDPSGVTSCSARVRTPRGTTPVRTGSRLRLRRPGSYALIVMAVDGRGNRRRRTVRWRAVSARAR